VDRSQLKEATSSIIEYKLPQVIDSTNDDWKIEIIGSKDYIQFDAI
jgi:hypothetical protein